MKNLEQKPEYVHQGVTESGKVISLPTEEATIEALIRAGGGIYTNLLHRFSFRVK